MISWGHVLAAKEIQRERIYEAEQWHLAHLASRQEKRHYGIYRPVLAWLGQRLTAWGNRCTVMASEPGR